MADIDILRTRLAEAEKAQHDLATGGRVVDVWKDGRRMRFQESDRASLNAYAEDLRKQVAAADAPTTGALPRRRFIGVSFG